MIRVLFGFALGAAAMAGVLALGLAMPCNDPDCPCIHEGAAS